MIANACCIPIHQNSVFLADERVNAPKMISAVLLKPSRIFIGVHDHIYGYRYHADANNDECAFISL
jgi:hypothetical protein